MTSSVRLRPIALPTEHGGWMIVIAPVLVGLLVAPSMSGVFLGFAAILAFLCRHPLKLFLGDVQAKKSFPRTRIAKNFAIAYGLGATLLIGACAITCREAWYWPLVGAIPCFAVQSWFDIHKQSRQFLAEALGTIGAGSFASSIALCAGVPIQQSLTLWILVSAQALSAIIYVGARLRRAHGQSYSVWPSLITHGGSLCIAIMLRLPLVVAASAIMAVRAAYGLTRSDPNMKAQFVGVQEIAYSLISVLAIAISYR